MGTGEFAALTAAACWATASLLYGKTRLSASGMNFAKNVVATLAIVIHLVVVAKWQGRPSFSADVMAWKWLGLSGFVGIVVGDTCYFRSLQILGARKALIVSTTAPVFAALLGFLCLGEVLTAHVTFGILLTIAGVIYVVADRASAEESPGLFPGSTSSGVLFGLCGAVCQAVGGVCSKIGMKDCDALEAAFIRLAVSAVGAFLVVQYAGQLRQVIRDVLDRSLLKTFLPAVLLGTWLGIWLCQVAFKHSTVSIATTLLATTPLFVLPLVWLFSGQRISGRAIVGSLIAVVGIAFVVN